MTTDALSQRLKDNCIGHPHAKIPWPHALLHEAADELDWREKQIKMLRGCLAEHVERLSIAGDARALKKHTGLQSLYDRSVKALNLTAPPADTEGA